MKKPILLSLILGLCVLMVCISDARAVTSTFETRIPVSQDDAEEVASVSFNSNPSQAPLLQREGDL